MHLRLFKRTSIGHYVDMLMIFVWFISMTFLFFPNRPKNTSNIWSLLSNVYDKQNYTPTQTNANFLNQNSNTSDSLSTDKDFIWTQLESKPFLNGHVHKLIATYKFF